MKCYVAEVTLILGKGAIVPPIKCQSENILLPPQSFSHFVGSSMPRMCLRPGLHPGPHWGSL